MSTRLFVLQTRREHLPALSTSRLSSFALHVAHALLDSQSSLPQQQVDTFGGSGEGTREKLERAAVRSSMVEVARRRLLGDSGESDVVDIVQGGGCAGAARRGAVNYAQKNEVPRCCGV